MNVMMMMVVIMIVNVSSDQGRSLSYLRGVCLG